MTNNASHESSKVAIDAVMALKKVKSQESGCMNYDVIKQFAEDMSLNYSDLCKLVRDAVVAAPPVNNSMSAERKALIAHLRNHSSKLGNAAADMLEADSRVEMPRQLESTESIREYEEEVDCAELIEQLKGELNYYFHNESLVNMITKAISILSSDAPQGWANAPARMQHTIDELKAEVSIYQQGCDLRQAEINNLYSLLNLLKTQAPVAYVKFLEGVVDYDSEVVISNTKGDCMDESIEWRPVYAAYGC